MERKQDGCYSESKRNKNVYEAWKTMYPSCTYPYQTLINYKLTKPAVNALTANNTNHRTGKEQTSSPSRSF